MSLVPDAVVQRRSRRAHGARRSSLAQKLMAASLVGVVVVLAVTQEQSRRVEAAIAAWAIETFLGVGANVSSVGSFLTVGAGTQHIFTLDVSFACSVTLLLIPFLLVAAGLLIAGRTTVFRCLPALVVGSGGLIVVNAARFVLIAAMTRLDGLDGFSWAHTAYGSGLVLTGLIVIEVFFVFLVTRTKRTN